MVGAGGRLGLGTLYAATLLLSAFLLFSVQPMMGRIVLPVLGGSPAVWTTALVFFQGALLLGYVVAHLSARRLALGAQILVHGALLAAAVLVLPVGLAEGTVPPPVSVPIAWLLGLLALTVGPPFLALAVTAPLLQRWFAHTGDAGAGDPYFLYAASNAGGFLALLCYPTLIEPRLGLVWQGRVWAVLYGLLVALVLLSALWAWRGREAAAASPAPKAPSSGVSPLERGRWVLLAFVPSSLLLGTTLHLSTDIAAAPFLWIAPLALYLLSFVLVFARRPPLQHRWMLEAQALFLILLGLYFAADDLRAALSLHLLGLFATAMVCHGELARRRPPVRDLTEFYLWISLGGFLGGLFNAIVAPLLFDSVVEYPLMLIAACLLRPWQAGRWQLDLAFGGLFALGFVVIRRIALAADALNDAFVLPFYAAASLILFLFRKQSLRFAVGVAGVLAGTVFFPDSTRVLSQERSFFGVYRVEEDPTGRYHRLRHGTTIHGAQDMHEGRRREPTTYYAREGPLGQALAALNAAGRIERIGAIGLGVGTIACYRESGQTLIFFEIDPLVEELARDPRLFSYLSECPGAEVRIADGRIGLAQLPDRHFDVLVVDAFGSDSIPLHLITREALALYFEKLAGGGVLLLHISNSYLDLRPVLADLARDAGASARVQGYEPSGNGAEAAAGVALSSRWVAMSRSPGDLALLDERWLPLLANGAGRPWTDDFSNLLGALLWSATPPE